MDEEHPLGARITLERDGRIAPFSITCGIYGWMVHTRFFASREQAETERDRMKKEIEDILSVMMQHEAQDEDEAMRRIGTLVHDFVERNP